MDRANTRSVDLFVAVSFSSPILQKSFTNENRFVCPAPLYRFQLCQTAKL
jgi:hypothetical protein